MYCSINKQLIHFKNFFGILLQFCYENSKKRPLHFKSLHGQHNNVSRAWEQHVAHEPQIERTWSRLRKCKNHSVAHTVISHWYQQHYSPTWDQFLWNIWRTTFQWQQKMVFHIVHGRGVERNCPLSSEKNIWSVKRSLQTISNGKT
jgi:hypothetical protein